MVISDSKFIMFVYIYFLKYDNICIFFSNLKLGKKIITVGQKNCQCWNQNLVKIKIAIIRETQRQKTGISK